MNLKPSALNPLPPGALTRAVHRFQRAEAAQHKGAGQGDAHADGQRAHAQDGEAQEDGGQRGQAKGTVGQVGEGVEEHDGDGAAAGSGQVAEGGCGG